MQVDKSVKVFSVGDEFVVHTFKAHLTASILHVLNLSSVSDTIEHETSEEWLQHTAERLVTKVLMPHESGEPVYCLHSAFLHHAFLYIDLREAIRWENGPHIVRHWKWWLTRILATARKNYAAESVYLLCNLSADFPKHTAYIHVATHNRTVNMYGSQ